VRTGPKSAAILNDLAAETSPVVTGEGCTFGAHKKIRDMRPLTLFKRASSR